MKAIQIDSVTGKTMAKTQNALEWLPELDKLISHFQVKSITVELEDNVTFKVGMSDTDFFNA